MRRIPYHRIRHLALLGIVAAATAREADAQRIGFEAGLADVENFKGVTPSLGLSGYLPFTERFRASASYSRWIGCDSGNPQCAEPRTGYGNQSFNLVGLYRVAGAGDLNASVGAGFGWYEMLRIRSGKSDSYFQDALTFSGELRRPVALNSAVYLRGDLSFPTDDDRPHWTSLRAGVDVGGIF